MDFERLRSIADCAGSGRLAPRTIFVVEAVPKAHRALVAVCLRMNDPNGGEGGTEDRIEDLITPAELEDVAASYRQVSAFRKRP